MKGIILFEAPAGEWLWGNRESSFLVLTVVRVRCWSRNSELYVPATACNRRGIRSPVDAGEAGSGAYPRAGHFTDGKESSREGEFHGRAREIWTESRRSSERLSRCPACFQPAPGPRRKYHHCGALGGRNTPRDRLQDRLRSHVEDRPGRRRFHRADQGNSIEDGRCRRIRGVGHAAGADIRLRSRLLYGSAPGRYFSHDSRKEKICQWPNRRIRKNPRRGI